MKYAINILDQSPICEHETANDALQATVDLAITAEKLGYHRFWVAEHHNMEQIAGSSPEVLIAHLLAHTKHINIGSGGVMLQHYSPYKIAENFHLLANLAPNRVDVGIGKAPGGLHLSTEALQYGRESSSDDFTERITLLNHFLKRDLPSTHALSGVEAMPLPKEKLDLFLLGGSLASAKLATSLDSHYVFARFLNNSNKTLEDIGNWQAHVNKDTKRKLIVAVAVLAAETKEEAFELARDMNIYEVTFSNGNKLSLQAKEHVDALRDQTTESFTVNEKKVAVIAGTAEMIKEELDELHVKHKIDEFIFHTPLHHREIRFNSFKLLGELYRKEGKTHE